MVGAEAAQAEGRDARRSQVALTVLVFSAGAGSLATEIGAARLLAPYFGNSTIVWANVIGLVLASLALGYWLGGRLADQRPSARLLGALVLAAGLAVAAIPFVAKPFLDRAVEGIDELSVGAAVGSFFGVLLLFAPPVILLGMVAPFAIRLAVSDVATAGSVAGRLYAVSTVGSLVGTFASALLTIPLVGTQRTLLGSACLIVLSAAFLLGPRWLLAAAAVAGLAAIPPGAVKAKQGLLYEDESRYQFIQVVERDDARRLYLDEGLAVHSIWRPTTVLTGGVWDMFLTVPPLLGRPVESVAILGNAGGTTARAFGVFYPQARIDGVEIDAAVTRVGRRYLGLDDNPRLEVHTADARPFLRSRHERYDLIFVDAYRPPYVPFYLATREFFRLARDRLEPGGIIALNVAMVPGDERLVDGVGGTLASEFPTAAAWQALRFNQLVLGFTRPVRRAELTRRLRAAPVRLQPLTRLLASELKPVKPADDPWTDDRSPVEWITDRMIVEYAAEGGDLDEVSLPTAP
jgi:predicted membrane-bound spermidine synthase